MTLSIEKIAAAYQVVTSEIRFLTEDEGGRCASVDFTCNADYRPHFVVQDRTERHARMNGNECTESYVAMTFIDGPKNYTNGESGVFRFYCPNWTHSNHPDINTGTEFTVREGGKIIAGGTVIEKTDPTLNPNAG